MGMTSHAIAHALDEYLSLTDPALRQDLEYQLHVAQDAAMPPALSALARLRWEAEQEVARLIALLDAIDGDPDAEAADGGGLLFDGNGIVTVVDGEYETGFEPNFATTESEDTAGSCSELQMGFVIGLDRSAPDELEAVCEDEGADDDREAVDEDGDDLDRGEENHRDCPFTAEEAGYRLTESGFVMTVTHKPVAELPRTVEIAPGYYKLGDDPKAPIYWCEIDRLMSAEGRPWVAYYASRYHRGDRRQILQNTVLAQFQGELILSLQ